MNKKEDFKVDPDIVNQETIDSFKLSMTPDAIPDMNNMLQHINSMISFMETPNMKELEKKNKKEFERMVFGKYNAILPIRIITLLVEDDRYEHLEQLLDMCDTLKQVKSGQKDIQQEFTKFSENMNQKFLYPKFGGKENFEKEMMKKPENKTPEKKSDKKK